MKRYLPYLLVLTWTPTAWSAAVTPATYQIKTVAGSGAGDGGLAALAQLGVIKGIAVDRSGNIFISETDNHRVRRVDPAGAISTVAGTGTPGFGGDGGAGPAAQLNLPYGLAVDSAGNLYIADLGNNRVRRVGTDGKISTVAGNGVKGSWGDGALAVGAPLFTPRNVALDAQGNLYIAEFDGQRVRRVTTDGRIATIAGTGLAGFRGDGGSAASAQLNAPAGLAIDRGGALYIADSQNNRIRKMIPGGIITTVLGASGGLATPYAVTVDALGVIYVGDSNNTAVYSYTPDGRRVLFAGGATADFQGDGGPAASAALTAVQDLASDAAGNLYLADNTRVRKVDASNTIRTVAGNGYYQSVGDFGPATAALLHRPSAIALDAAGNLLIADTGTERLRQVLPSGTIITLAGTGVAVAGSSQNQMPAVATGLNKPMGVAAGFAGSIYVADTGNHRIRVISSDRTILTAAGTMQAGMGPDGGPPTQTQLNSPQAVCADRSGVPYIADTQNHRVLRISLGGVVETVAGNGSPGSSGDGGSAVSAQLNQPGACALDSFSNLYIADTANHRIRKVSPSGVISTVAGTGDAGSSGDEGPAVAARIQSPLGVAVDDNGDLFIADTGGNRIRQVTPDGVIHTVAGQTSAGFGGDGGAATAALLNRPAGLFLDGAGALYVADTNNDRVRLLVPVAPQTPVSVMTPPPALTVVNAASLLPGPVAPGEIVAILGGGLGPATGVPATFDSGNLPTTLGGTQVLCDGVPAPLFYAQSGQINVQVPYAVAGNPVTHVEIVYQAQSMGALDLTVAATNPALYPVAVNENGSANSAKAPAGKGAVLTFYATGEGLTDGANVSGQTAQVPYPRPALPVTLQIGGVAAQVVDAFSAPGVVGVLQVNGRMPDGIAPGQTTVQLAVGTAATPAITIWAK